MAPTLNSGIPDQGWWSMTTLLKRIPELIQPRHLGLAGLVMLAAAYMALFRYDAYGIEEGAALGLLLNWSIVHQIASPVALFGIPDLRAIFFIPLDLHWAGSLPSAKVYTMLVLFASALMLYRWYEREQGAEPSMIATALMLLSPVALMQTDSIGSGVYLLFCFIAIGWLLKIMAKSRHALPSWFFLIMLLTAMAVSIHPMGLAVPLALGLRWWLQQKRQGQGLGTMLSLAAVTAIMLFLRWGWYGMPEASSNPLVPLGDILLGTPLLREPGWGAGLIIADLWIIATGIHVYRHRRSMDAVSLVLVLAGLIGIFHADQAWAFVVWAGVLYLGVPLLIELNSRWGWSGLAGQRGFVLALVLVAATLMMLHDRQYGWASRQHLKSDTDMVIAILEKEAGKLDEPFLAASQWPARTLLACRRDVLPLPPVTNDADSFKKQIQGLTHIAFDPNRPSMHELARQLASLSHEFETLGLLPGGVVLRAKQNSRAEHSR